MLVTAVENCKFQQEGEISFLYVCMVNTIYLLSFVETPRKFIIAALSIRKLGSSARKLCNNNLRGVSTNLNK